MRCLYIFLLFVFTFTVNAQESPKLIPQFKHRTPIADYAFSEDKKYLVTTSLNGEVKIWHVATKKIIQSFRDDICDLFQSKPDNTISPLEALSAVDFIGMQMGGDIYTQVCSNLFHSPKFKNNNQILELYNEYNFKYEFNILTGKRISRSRYPFNKEKIAYHGDKDSVGIKVISELNPIDNYDGTYDSAIYGDSIMVFSVLNKTNVLNLRTLRISSLPLKKPIRLLPRKNYLIGVSISNPNIVEAWSIFDLGKVAPYKICDFLGHSDEILTMDIDYENKFLVTGGKDKKVLVWELPNLESTKKSFVVPDRKPIEVFTGHSQPIDFVGFKNLTAFVYGRSKSNEDRDQSQMSWEFYTPEEKKKNKTSGIHDPNRMYTYDGRYFFKNGSSGEFEVYTDIDEKGIRKSDGNYYNRGKISTKDWYEDGIPHSEIVGVSPKGSYIVVRKNLGVNSVYSVFQLVFDRYDCCFPFKWKLIKEVVGWSKFKFSANEKYLILETKIFDLNTNSFSIPNIEFLFLRPRDMRDEDSENVGVLFFKKLPYIKNIENVLFSNDESYLFIFDDELITAFNIKEQRYEYFFILDDEIENSAVIHHSGYYLCPNNPRNLDKLCFVNNNLAPGSLRQYQSIFNRPDTILQLLSKDFFKGEINPEMNAWITNYKNARDEGVGFNFTNDTLTLLEAPILNVLSTKIEGKNAIIEMEVKSEVGINFTTVLVNGCPIPQNQITKSHTSKDQKAVKQVAIFDLSSGENIIELYTTDTKGFSSAVEVISFEQTLLSKKPSVYFIGVGFSDYKSGKLYHADQDVRDLAKHFLQQQNHYEQIFIDTFINISNIYESLKKIKSKMEHADVNDIVFFYWVGHGRNINNQLNLIESNEVNSVDFLQIKKLIDNSPSRKKVLLVNVCESGKKALRNQESLNLFNELWFDFNEGGETIIASSLGTQSSFTSNDISEHNTFFCKALLWNLEPSQIPISIKEILPQQLKKSLDKELTIYDLYKNSKEFLDTKLILEIENETDRKKEGTLSTPELRKYNPYGNFSIK